MPRFRVSYTYTFRCTGSAEVIASALRHMSFSKIFNPIDLSDMRVSPSSDGTYELRCPHTVAEYIFETSERAALRKFLYNMDLPEDIDPKKITVERLSVPSLVEEAA